MTPQQVERVVGPPLERTETSPGQVTQSYSEKLDSCCRYFDLTVSFEQGSVVDVIAAHHVPYEHILIYRQDREKMFEIQPFEQLLGRRPRAR
jgi:hypothetical protein